MKAPMKIGDIIIFSMGVAIFANCSMQKSENIEALEEFRVNEPIQLKPPNLVSHDDYDMARLIMESTDEQDIDSFKRLFLEEGLSPNGKTSAGFTLLELATYQHRTKIVQFLIQQGADVNLRSDNGNLPLHRAAASDDIVIAQFLIDAGAAVNERTKQGSTAIQIAARNGNAAVYGLLSLYGAIIQPDGVTGDERFGLSEETRKRVNHEYLLAQRKAACVADWYSPLISDHVKLRVGDYFQTKKEQILWEALAEDNPLSWNGKHIVAPIDTWLVFKEARSSWYFVHAVDHISGRVLYGGWMLDFTLSEHFPYSGEKWNANNFRLHDKLRALYEGRVGARYNLSDEQLGEVMIEAYKESWIQPPFETQKQIDVWITEAEQELGPRPHNFLMELSNGDG